MNHSLFYIFKRVLGVALPAVWSCMKLYEPWAVVRVWGLSKQKRTPLEPRSSNSSRLPKVLSTASRLFHKEEGVGSFLSSVNHTANKSTEVLKPPFPLMISPMNHNKGHRANTVGGSHSEDNQTGWSPESHDLPPISRWRCEEKKRAKKKRSTQEKLQADALIQPVWYWFISQPWAPEWLPYWAHLRKNLYLHSPNWVPTLKREPPLSHER